ncbi:MAG: anthranilate synthase component [Methanohalophilus sp.]|nr:anthranilate synthase component [Methanohalophilus sp.]
MNFDITKEEFIDLVGKRSGSCMVLLMADVPANCTPLQLYTLIHDKPFSYLLESVEKESRHARFSFIGANPEFVLSVSGKTVSVEYLHMDSFVKTSVEGLKEVCEIHNETKKGFMGVIKKGFNPLDAIRSSFITSKNVPLLNEKDFGKQTFLGGAIGYLGYDLIYECLLDQSMPFDSEIPDARLMFCQETFLFDHMEDKIYLVFSPFIATEDNPAEIYDSIMKRAAEMQDLLAKASESQLQPANQDTKPVPKLIGCSMDQKEFEAAVRKSKEHVFDGDIFQVVISRKCEVSSADSSFQLYRKLREINPSPYMYLLDLDEMSIIGASPETLMSIYKRQISTNPIAGTCKRGKNEEEDLFFAFAMLNDEKEKAEHIMLVDLSRNDVRRVSKGGTVKVEDFMKVVRYSHVQHIESTVIGDLRPECDQFDAVVSLMPAGTLSGAPKIRAMEIIRDIEGAARGAYGGGVGYFSWNGDLDFAITIRTIVKQGNILSIQAGAGIVADSDPASEYRETESKMAAMLGAVGVK